MPLFSDNMILCENPRISTKLFLQLISELPKARTQGLCVLFSYFLDAAAKYLTESTFKKKGLAEHTGKTFNPST